MPQKSRTCTQCPSKIYADNKSGLCRPCLDRRNAVTITVGEAPAAQVAADRDKQRTQAVIAELKGKYTEVVKQLEAAQSVNAWVEQIREGIDTTFRIEGRHGSGTSEATPIIIASDWHVEETVTSAQVNGMNVFNLETAERRITRFFQASLNLIRNHLNPGVTINTVVLALLGDFITNDIHDAENAEANSLLPIPAIIWVQNRLIAGIDFLLNNSPYYFVIPCKVGNHSRTTKKTRFGSETGHSLETLMYTLLATNYRSEPRVKFVIDDGYHTYLDIYDQTIRFHHGHALKFQGGVGGLFIPAYKAIAQWDQGRQADLDVFGHFHQSKDGGKFVCNGSLIGYNAFALSIKASFERPKQTLLLIDKKRGRTCNWPILLEKQQ